MGRRVISPSCKAGNHSVCRGTALSCECEHHKIEAAANAAAAAARAARDASAQPSRDEFVSRAPGKHLPVVELVWEDPPSANRRSSTVDKVSKLIPDLRRDPGTWARIAVYRAPTAAGTSIAKMRGAFPDIEFTSRRNNEEGTSALYARAPEEVTE